MREVKFRFYDPSIKAMLTPSCVGEYGFYAEDRDFEDGRSLPFDRLMQFTGLLDKNGKEVFEGDILKVEAPYDDEGNTRNIVVKWHDDGGYVIEWDNGFNGGDSDLTVLGWARAEDYQFEVIGNIYSNPELLTPTGNGDKQQV